MAVSTYRIWRRKYIRIKAKKWNGQNNFLPQPLFCQFFKKFNAQQPVPVALSSYQDDDFEVRAGKAGG
jgi:hypothetical protein